MLPAFSGLVPPAFQTVYPAANVTSSSGWGGEYIDSWNDATTHFSDFPPTQFLYPMDPLFRAIQISFLTRQMEEYGTDHLYNCDL